MTKAGVINISSMKVDRTCDLSSEQIMDFQQQVYQHYLTHGRVLPWRETHDPYKILVSELMLQQTQVERVIAKYQLFLNEFPSFSALANAPLQNVLEVWRGLGYNKRAIALKRIAQTVITQCSGKLPSDYSFLVSLPNVGPATASAIRTFAFNIPSVFIETNIRTVFIHTFYANQLGVKDASLYPLVECTLDRSNPRTWYYALMDYGVMLKKRYKNPGRKSAQHRTQAAFSGSNRQLRGKIISLIIANPGITQTDLTCVLNDDDQLISRNLQKLEAEGFLTRDHARFYIA